MKNIRIQEVGDVNFDYSYLEVFFKDDKNPSLEIGISEEKKLLFKIYPSRDDILINLEEWEYLLIQAKQFFIEALKNQDDFLDFKDG